MTNEHLSRSAASRLTRGEALQIRRQEHQHAEREIVAEMYVDSGGRVTAPAHDPQHDSNKKQIERRHGEAILYVGERKDEGSKPKAEYRLQSSAK